MAQSIFGSLEAQAIKLDASGQPKLDAQNHQQLNDAAKLPSISGPVNLGSTGSYSLYATNDGQVNDASAGAVYAISIGLTAAPANFDPAYAIEVTVTVAWPFGAPAANQTRRDFVRIITSY